MQSTLNTVVVLLSIGTVAGPILFGFLMFKAMSIFVSTKEFSDYKLLAQVERENMKESLKRIESKVDTISDRP